MNSTKIQILTTGGTIDKSYNEDNGEMVNMGSHLKTYIFNRMRLPYTKIEVEEIMAIDSLFMTDHHREIICERVKVYNSKSIPVLVIHGTDTMELTANLCFKKIKKPLAPIVFTGAMVPIGLIDSDGNQNIAEALMACKILKSGVYISFHNQIFQVPNATKLREKRTFGTIDK